jgi:hypothetical protein
MAFPANFNFSYYQGDKYEFVIRPKQSNGEPFNLAGYTGLFTVATTRGFFDAIIGPNASAGFTSTASVDFAAGTVTCVIDPPFGQTLTGNSYVYDLEISANAGEAVHTLVTGNISVTRDITNTLAVE